MGAGGGGLMASEATRAAAQNFDTCRRLAGITGNLALVQATATGYTALVTITAGWDLARKRNPETGAQLLCVAVAELDAIDPADFKAASAAVIEGRRYKIQTIERPTGNPRTWQLLCDPTGEAA